MKITHFVRIRPDAVCIDGTRLATEESGIRLLGELYRSSVADYPKFFKMDPLSKLGFLAVELLVKDEPDRFRPREDRAVLLFSRSGSLCDDRSYEKTIAESDYFPSPALFVYTLANTVTGEIAIRNKYEGDTTAYAMAQFDPGSFIAAVSDAFEDRITTSAVCGWVECPEADRFEATVLLVEQDAPDGLPFTEETLENLLQ